MSYATSASTARSKQHRWPGHELPIDTAVDPPVIAFACAANCVSPAYLLAIANSMVSSQQACAADLDAALRTRRHRDILRWIDPALESGIESVVSYWLHSARIAFRSQVTIPGVGRVDFLIGNRLIIEVDGREWAVNRGTVHNERER